MATWPPWVFTAILALFHPIRPRWPTRSLLRFSQSPEVVVRRILPAPDRSDIRSHSIRGIASADQRAVVRRCVGGAVIGQNLRYGHLPTATVSILERELL